MFGIFNLLWRFPKWLHRLEVASCKAAPICADALQNDYTNNRISADKKYKNKVVRFESTVHSITEELGDPVLYCQTNSGLLRCECISSSVRVLKGLPEGHRVQVTGFVNGLCFAYVVITGCNVTAE